MPVYVVDSSVIAKLFLAEEERDKAQALLQQAIDGKAVLRCPALMLYEVTNVFIIQGIEVDAIKHNLAKLQGLIDHGILAIIAPTVAHLEKTVELAATDTGGLGHISSYDAVFHALALQEGGIFITADKKHVQRTRSLFGAVMALADFPVPTPSTDEADEEVS
jgi:predicted nucleic acid-binding protein